LDNPGVSVTINLNGTELKEATYPETNQSYETENDWMICRKSEGTFEGRGAPGRLEDILLAFLNWAESHEKA
jgi:hypothetical protein